MTYGGHNDGWRNNKSSEEVEDGNRKVEQRER